MSRPGATNRNRSINLSSVLGWIWVVLTGMLVGGCIGNSIADPKAETVEKNVAVGETVVVDLAGANAAEDDSLFCVWTQTGGPSAQLIETNSSQLAFTPEEGGEYEFTLTITDSTGGSRVMTVRVIVSESQVPAALRATAGPDQAVSRGGSAVLAGAATGGTPPYQYAWTPADGLDDPAAAQPSASPLATTVYMLAVTDSEGVVASDQVQVTVEQPPPLQAEAGPDQMVLPGGSVVLAGTATGGTPPYQYAWTPADGLDNPASAQPTATPSANTTYTLTVTDRDGTTVSDSTRISLGTAVSGPYWTNTTWTTTNSPYVLVGDVQIPEAITLSIEPGVQVLYTGTTQIHVRGALVANGTPAQKIEFTGADSTSISEATFIKFEATNLSDSQLSYVRMARSARAVRVGEHMMGVDEPKNIGTLTIANAELDTTEVRTNGNETGARLVLTGCTLTSSSVIGAFGRSEPIDLANCTISGCQINSEGYNLGIAVTGSSISDTVLNLNGGGSNISVQHSVLTNSKFRDAGRYAADGPLVLGHCQCANVGIYLPDAVVHIADSEFQFDALYSSDYQWDMPLPGPPSSKLTVGTGDIEFCTITGNTVGEALNVTGHFAWMENEAFSIDHCTIQQNETGILLSQGTGACAITFSNFSANTAYAVDNRRTIDVDAESNFWDTTDPAEIATKIHDYYDDINLGKAVFTPSSATVIQDACPRP